MLLQLLSLLSISIAFADVNNTADYVINPQDYVLPVLKQTCQLSQLTISIDYVSTTDLAIYVYPPFMETRCDVMSMYYTALGAPTIPDAKNLTAWYVSDIMSGLTCFGIQNVDTHNTANVNIQVSMSCNPVSSGGSGGSGSPMARGWYFSKPKPGSVPVISSSSTGEHFGSTGTTPNSARKNECAVLQLLILGILAMVMRLL